MIILQILGDAAEGENINMVGCEAIQLERAPLATRNTIQASGASGQITIGKALEATAMTAGQKPVEWSDAAAIQGGVSARRGCGC
ncbi:unnamed protein product [Prunus armeniaca]|uniref:SMP domain-containing protein n=1 Tax=Prunus armeniaca TaxID=36596 RepID=A0A6J5V6Q2_PRUAR|nr:unnamed protein product [Prunus armeniaca]CAB4314283.1 unnamed protein product [Prunus armeniaca]